MDYDKNYIQTDYTEEELNKMFVKDFAKFRRENNLTQTLLSKYSGVNREKIARIELGMHSPSIKSILKILGPVGYTLKIEKIEKKDSK
jgi:transcriptional regulator with XRE-family HTH domain